jgi:hypothetical protein
MSRPIIRIVESDGTFIDREMNDAEFKQYKLDEAQGLQRIAEAEAKAEAKTIAQAKFAALGLTVEDLQALGL